jgi:hypothetical protein
MYEEVLNLLQNTDTSKRQVLAKAIIERTWHLTVPQAADLIVAEGLHPAIKIDWAQVEVQ